MLVFELCRGGEAGDAARVVGSDRVEEDVHEQGGRGGRFTYREHANVIKRALRLHRGGNEDRGQEEESARSGDEG